MENFIEVSSVYQDRGNFGVQRRKRLNDIVELLGVNSSYLPVTVRSIYYLLISSRLYSQPHWLGQKRNGVRRPLQDVYSEVCHLCGIGRINGMIEWDYINDDSRIVTRKAGSTTDTDNVVWNTRVHIPGFSMCLAAHQPNYIEVWVEKNGLVHVLEPIADEYCRRVVGCKGFPSLRTLNDYKERVDLLSIASSEPYRNIILYFGDLDPTGWLIPKTIAGILDVDFQVNVEVYRCGLNPGMTEGLVPMPEKDSAANKQTINDVFYQETGVIDCFGYELDALPFVDLESLCENALEHFTDGDIHSADKAFGDRVNDTLRRVRGSEYIRGLNRDVRKFVDDALKGKINLD